jgi:hypothetical protein
LPRSLLPMSPRGKWHRGWSSHTERLRVRRGTSSISCSSKNWVKLTRLSSTIGTSSCFWTFRGGRVNGDPSGGRTKRQKWQARFSLALISRLVWTIFALDFVLASDTTSVLPFKSRSLVSKSKKQSCRKLHSFTTVCWLTLRTWRGGNWSMTSWVSAKIQSR